MSLNSTVLSQSGISRACSVLMARSRFTTTRRKRPTSMSGRLRRAPQIAAPCEHEWACERDCLMLNQFIIPTWLVVGLPSLILLIILVWFAVAWWRARRDDAARDIDVRCERPVCC